EHRAVSAVELARVQQRFVAQLEPALKAAQKARPALRFRAFTTSLAEFPVSDDDGDGFDPEDELMVKLAKEPCQIVFDTGWVNDLAAEVRLAFDQLPTEKVRRDLHEAIRRVFRRIVGAQRRPA